MKITKTTLRRIIKEELQRVLREDMQDGPRRPRRRSWRSGLGAGGSMGEMLAPYAKELCPNRSNIINRLWDDDFTGEDWQADMAEVLSEYGVEYQLAFRVAGLCEGEGCLEEALDFACESDRMRDDGGVSDEAGFIPGEEDEGYVAYDDAEIMRRGK